MNLTSYLCQSDITAGNTQRRGIKAVYNTVNQEYDEREPVGIVGSGPISFGGGQQGGCEHP